MKLTTKQRNGLEASTFALPGRRYPLSDPSHARNALARAAQHASPSEQATIKRKVKSKFPSIEVGGKPKKFSDGGPVALASKGIEVIGKAMGTEKGKAIKAAEEATKQPEKAGGESKRATQINRQIEAAGG